MEWNYLADASGIIAPGDRNVYLVTWDCSGGDVTGVRLTRYLARPNPSAFAVAQEAARNVIVFPLGRGPGRPGGEPELAALAESAKTFAERYEADESLEGYPAWQHERPAPAFRLREGESVRFIGEPPEPFPHQAEPGGFGTSHVYGTQPGCCAPEPGVEDILVLDPAALANARRKLLASWERDVLATGDADDC